MIVGLGFWLRLQAASDAEVLFEEGAELIDDGLLFCRTAGAAEA